MTISCLRVTFRIAFLFFIFKRRVSAWTTVCSLVHKFEKVFRNCSSFVKISHQVQIIRLSYWALHIISKFLTGHKNIFRGSYKRMGSTKRAQLVNVKLNTVLLCIQLHVSYLRFELWTIFLFLQSLEELASNTEKVCKGECS